MRRFSHVNTITPRLTLGVYDVTLLFEDDYGNSVTQNETAALTITMAVGAPNTGFVAESGTVPGTVASVGMIGILSFVAILQHRKLARRTASEMLK